MQAANCQYTTACQHLNFATSPNRDWAGHTQSAEQLFRQALRYYEDAGMRELSAQTALKLATLLLNASTHADSDAVETQLIEAENLLIRANNDVDAVRANYSAKDRTQMLQGKIHLGQLSQSICREALRLFAILAPDAKKAFLWSINTKAQALKELLTHNVDVPRTIVEVINKDPEAMKLVMSERELVASLANAPLGKRQKIQESLQSIRRQLCAIPKPNSYSYCD